MMKMKKITSRKLENQRKKNGFCKKEEKAFICGFVVFLNHTQWYFKLLQVFDLNSITLFPSIRIVFS